MSESVCLTVHTSHLVLGTISEMEGLTLAKSETKGSLQKKKSVTFFTLGGGQDRSSLHFSKTCLKCVSSHSESFKIGLRYTFKIHV